MASSRRRAEARHLAGVLGDVELDAHVALRAEVVDLVRLDIARGSSMSDERRSDRRSGGQASTGDVRILVEVLDALPVLNVDERRMMPWTS